MPPLVDADWHAFCQAIYKGIGGEEWEELYCHNREMSRVTGAKNHVRVKKQEPFWAMKAGKDREEVYSYPARTENILGRKKTRLELWEEHFKDPIIALDKALKCLENT